MKVSLYLLRIWIPIFLLLAPLSCKDDAYAPLSEDELMDIQTRILLGDDAVFEGLPEHHRTQVVESVISAHYEDYQPLVAAAAAAGLPNCGGYWTSYWAHTVVEQKDSNDGLLL